MMRSMSSKDDCPEETHHLLNHASTSAPPFTAKPRSNADKEDDKEQPRSWKSLTLILIVATLVIVLLLKFPWGRIQELLDYMRENPGQTMPIFFVLNAVAVVVLLPAAAFQMVGGAVYGLVTGWLLSFAASCLGVLGAFLLGRYLFKEQLSGWIATKIPQYSAIEAAIFREDGWKLVWLLRFTPGLPDGALNYAMGVTSCSLSLFAAASAASLFAYSFLNAYLGHVSGDIIATLKGGDAGDAKLRLALTVGSLLLGVATIAYIVVVLRRALNKVLAEQQGTADEVEGLLAEDATPAHHTAVDIGGSGSGRPVSPPEASMRPGGRPP